MKKNKYSEKVTINGIEKVRVTNGVYINKSDFDRIDVFLGGNSHYSKVKIYDKDNNLIYELKFDLQYHAEEFIDEFYNAMNEDKENK